MDEEFKKLSEEILSAYQNKISQEEFERIVDRLIEAELKIRGGVERGAAANPGQG